MSASVMSCDVARRSQETNVTDRRVVTLGSRRGRTRRAANASVASLLNENKRTRHGVDATPHPETYKRGPSTSSSPSSSLSVPSAWCLVPSTPLSALRRLLSSSLPCSRRGPRSPLAVQGTPPAVAVVVTLTDDLSPLASPAVALAAPAAASVGSDTAPRHAQVSFPLRSPPPAVSAA